MAKRLIFVTFLALLFLVGAGCTEPVTVYYPLKVGNAWTFTTTDIATDIIKEDKELIVKKEREAYFFENGETLIEVSHSSLINKGGYILLKSPLEVGHEWRENDATMKVTAVKQAYTVPAGTFSDTVEVQWRVPRKDDKDPEQTFIDIMVFRYAKGVGPIYYYYEVQRPDGSLTPIFKSELTKFENIRGK